MSAALEFEASAPWSAIGLDATDPQQRRSLIEASAGTGKTWTISVLYLRLLLETGRRVSEIVVTTFTDAAAHELRQRIRARLNWAVHEVARRGVVVDDKDDAELRAWLRRRWQGVDAQHDAIALRLALFELDRAPIGTMHALCLRLLTDAPLAAGGALRVASLIGDDELYQEIGEDLLRELAFRNSTDDEERSAITAMLQESADKRRNLLRAIFAPGVVLRAAADPAPDILHDAAAWALRLRDLANRDIYLKRKRAAADQLRRLADFVEAGDARAPYKPSNKTLDENAALVDQIQPEHIDALLADPTYRYARNLSHALEQRGGRG